MNLASILILASIAGLFVAAVRRTRKKGSSCCEQSSTSGFLRGGIRPFGNRFRPNGRTSVFPIDPVGNLLYSMFARKTYTP